MPQVQGSSSASGGRLYGRLQKTPVVVGDFVAGAGWGTASVLALAPPSGSVCTDQRGCITITASTTGLSQATATVVFTFKDGAYETPPFAIVTTTNNNSIDTGKVTWSTTTTALTMTFSLLPVDTKVYTFTYALIA
jgi:hypothetical protein